LIRKGCLDSICDISVHGGELPDPRSRRVPPCPLGAGDIPDNLTQHAVRSILQIILSCHPRLPWPALGKVISHNFTEEDSCDVTGLYSTSSFNEPRLTSLNQLLVIWTGVIRPPFSDTRKALYSGQQSYFGALPNFTARTFPFRPYNGKTDVPCGGSCTQGLFTILLPSIIPFILRKPGKISKP